MTRNNTRTGNRRSMRLAVVSVLAGGLLAGIAPAANAHYESHHRAVHYHGGYVKADYPRWLRKHRSFKRWYVNSRYYRQDRKRHRQIAWHRLYEFYLIDRFEARHVGKHWKKHYYVDARRSDDRRRDRRRDHRRDGD